MNRDVNEVLYRDEKIGSAVNFIGVAQLIGNGVERVSAGGDSAKRSLERRFLNKCHARILYAAPLVTNDFFLFSPRRRREKGVHKPYLSIL